MKRKLLKLLIAVALMVSLVSPVHGAPTYDDFVFAQANYPDGSIIASFHLNTTNLHVDSFTLENNTLEREGLIRLYDPDMTTDDNIFFLIEALPGETVTQDISGFKLHRTPLNDPDDPDSLRYPNKTFLSFRAG